MGFFKKIFKGVKKVFKKIGKGIKSAFKKVGKFMGKLGIIGQIGLGLLLPGIGTLLGNTAGFLAAQGGIVGAAGNFINAAINIGTKIGKTFTTITKGVSNVIGEVVGTAANKLGLDAPVKFITDKLNMGVDGKGIDISNKNFGNLFDRVGNAASEAFNKGRDLFTLSDITEPNQFMSDKLRDQLTSPVEDVVQDKAINVEAEAVTPTEGGSATKAVTDATVKKDPSLLSRLADDPIGTLQEGAEYLGEKALTKTGEAITDAVPTAITTATQKAAGGIPDVVYNTYSTSIAQLPQSSSVGSGDIDMFDPFAYVNNNTNFMNTQPIGYNASAYNMYQQKMRGVA